MPGKPILMRVVWRLVLIAVCVLAGLLIIVLVFQAKYVYHPTRRLENTPEDILLDYEDVTFEASDGVRLHGWFVPAAEARGVVLFCHGNAGNISHRLMSLAAFNELSLSTFIFDYRGYGRSEGSASEAGTYLDADAAWRWLTDRRGVAPGRIVLFGRSLGGAVATDLAARTRPAGLIVESSFTSMPDLAAGLYPFLPIRPLMRIKYDTLGKIGSVGCGVLVIHSRDDELIPYEHGRRLFDAARQPKHFLELRGGHNAAAGEETQAYHAALNAFLMEVLGGGATATGGR